MLAAFDTPFNALIKPGILTQIIIGIQIINDCGLGSSGLDQFPRDFQSIFILQQTLLSFLYSVHNYIESKIH